MQVTKQLVESLLWESEGTTLDFKSEQYALSGSTDEKKSELLKDILAFANAFRRTDAFILIGVKENKGGRAHVVGLAQQLEDAHVQQFVNSKTQRPIEFSYRSLEIDEKRIGVIHIPLQRRPFHSKLTYGSVSKDVVYVRRGSSTAVATPDEIASMGADQSPQVAPEPVLSLSLWDSSSGETIGNEINVASVVVKGPQKREIPDYVRPAFGGVSINLGWVNEEYYRELAEFVKADALLRAFSFELANTGTVTAPGVRCLIEVPDDRKRFIFMHGENAKNPPVQATSPLGPMKAVDHLSAANRRLVVTKTGSKWRIEFDVGKIQPKDTVRIREKLLIGVHESMRVNLDAKIFADNLSNPICVALDLNAIVEECQLTVEDLMKAKFDNIRESRKRVVSRFEI